MFHKKTLLTLAILGLVLTAGIATTSAFSGLGNGNGDVTGTGDGNFANRAKPDSAQHEAIEEALEAGDYETWSELIGNHPMSGQITAENFDQLVQMHELMQAGDREGAQAIVDELGLQGPGPGGRGGHGGFGKFHGGDFEFTDHNGDGVCNQLDLDIEAAQE